MDISTRNEYIPQAAEFIRMFEKQLTKKELALIFRFVILLEFNFLIQQFIEFMFWVDILTKCSQDSEDKRYTMFFLIWALKEAYIKAIGSGLAFSLQNVS